MAVRVRRWSDVDARRKYHMPTVAHSHHAHGASDATALEAAHNSSDDRRSSLNEIVTVRSMALNFDDDADEDHDHDHAHPHPHAQEEEPEECVICLDELLPGRALFTAECGHKFHFSCVLENVNHDEANSDKCPICRKSQTQWPEQTKGLVKAHPYCTHCGKRGTGGQFCDGCGHSLAHTPTAQERARAAAAAAAARSNVVVECPTCRIRCLVSTNARGTLQCPNGHLFQVRMPSSSGPAPGPGSAPSSAPPSFSSGGGGGGGGTRNSLGNSRMSFTAAPPSRPVMRQCPTCYTRVQMPPGSLAGQYMCPLGHTFYYDPRMP